MLSEVEASLLLFQRPELLPSQRRATLLAPTYPSASSQTRLYHKYSSGLPHRNRGCRSTWTGDPPERGSNSAEPPSLDKTANRRRQAERSLRPVLRRSHTPVRRRYGCDLRLLRLRVLCSSWKDRADSGKRRYLHGKSAPADRRIC